jgi:hypothetical protein
MHLADFADALEAVAHLDSLLEQQLQGQHVRLLLQRSPSKCVSLIYLFVFNKTKGGFSSRLSREKEREKERVCVRERWVGDGRREGERKSARASDRART